MGSIPDLYRGARVLPDLTKVDPAAGRLSRGRAPKLADERLRALFAAGSSDDVIAAEAGCCLATVRLRRLALGLRRRKVRGSASGATVKAGSRHEPRSLDDHVARMPPVNHPALHEARTIYPASVVSPVGLLNALVSGDNSWKIGSAITKGRWRGFPIYTLTLQERATCPTSCGHWRSCYGNGMTWAKRIVHGPDLEERIRFEVGVLSYRHPGGFAVRLHVLGDFYSVAYVEEWRALLEQFPALHAFGFSARIDDGDPIAAALRDLIADHRTRFAIRLSNAPNPLHSTVTIEHPLQRPADAIVCPQQTGRTASCGTCALCWSTDRRIAFLRH